MKRSRQTEHECGEWQCQHCKNYFLSEHFCHMQSATPKPIKPRFVFFDFECRQDGGTHIPNFVVAQTVCSDCEDSEVTANSECATCGDRCELCSKWDAKKNEYKNAPCHGCGKRQIVFQGDNTRDVFGAWLFNGLRKHSTVLAHNAKGYDAHFLLAYLIENSVAPKIIFSGSKILS